MALIDSNGRYLKINGMSQNDNEASILYFIYTNNQKTDIEITNKSDYNPFIKYELDDKDMLNKMITGGYLTLKQNGFQDWNDC